MNFRQMLKTLHGVYNRNAEKIKERTGSGGIKESLEIVALSGPSGIGKTACVEQFAKEKGFGLKKVDCSHEPAHFLAIQLFNCIQCVLEQKQPGFVILLDNVDQADDEHLKIIRQYRRNHLDTRVPLHGKESAGSTMASATPAAKKIVFKQLPETIFLVAEKRP